MDMIKGVIDKVARRAAAMMLGCQSGLLQVTLGGLRDLLIQVKFYREVLRMQEDVARLKGDADARRVQHAKELKLQLEEANSRRLVTVVIGSQSGLKRLACGAWRSMVIELQLRRGADRMGGGRVQRAECGEHGVSVRQVRDGGGGVDEGSVDPSAGGFAEV